MLSYRIRSGMAAGAGFSLILVGTLAMIGSAVDFSTYQQAVGTLLLALGAVFIGVMASISLTGQSTEEINRNVIKILEQNEIILSELKLRIMEDGRAVKAISNTLSSSFDIEKPYWKAAV